MKWAYGVTTTPFRRKDLLPQTLASLYKAGFNIPRLFVDGSDGDARSWAKEFSLNTTIRDFPEVKAYGNWVLALWELYLREPTAERFAIFQDDFVTYPNLRAYLEQCPFPEKGYWNLYTFPHNQSLCPVGSNGQQKIGWYTSNQAGRGAVGLVFNRDGVLELLSSRHMAERPMDPQRGWKVIDGGVVESMRKAGYTEWVHNPSLQQHMGEVSSMGNRPHAAAISFRGENFNALELLKEIER